MNESPHLTRIAGRECAGHDCPAIFITDRDTLAVQGYDVARETPSGESVVEIPVDVLKEAVRALGW